MRTRNARWALVRRCRPVYDCLLDDYEKGMTAARLDEIFAQVGPCLAQGESL